ncbi:MAG: AmiS/UreI family transporter [Desulfurococcaceae archaeon]
MLFLILEPVGTAMMFYGLVLFMFARQLFGKAEAKAVGLVVTAAGFIGLITGLFAYIGLGLALPEALVIVFALTFIMAGIWNIRGLSPKTLAYFLMYLGIADAMYAIYFAILGLLIFSAFCWAWFIVYLLFVLALLRGKPMYGIAAKYWCLVCSFITLLIPGFLLVAGVAFG